MKQFLLTTAVGRVALAWRAALGLLSSMHRRPETVGWLVNDHLATELLVSICRPSGRFLDVGAHIGSVIAAVRHAVPSATIEAVEAVPEKALALQRRFPGVVVHACAVGDAAGDAAFFHSTRHSGYSSLSRPTDVPAPTVQTLRVPVRRLDDLVTSDDVDVIKIDVEGAELRVLRGAAGLIDRCRPLVMFESGTPEEPAHWDAARGVHGFFTSRRYEILLPNRMAHEAPGLSLPAFLEGHWHPRCTTNYFAVPSERRIDFRDRARRIRGAA